MLGRARSWIGAAGVVCACTPTVDLGSNVGSTAGFGGSDDASASSGGLVGSTRSSGGSDTAAVGADSGTGASTGTGPGSGTSTGTAGTETDDGTSQSCGDAFPAGFPCLTCAELSC